MTPGRTAATALASAAPDTCVAAFSDDARNDGNQANAARVTTTHVRAAFDTSAWPRGSHRLHVLLEDASGNTVTLTERTVQIG